jgi:hypothetical protein
MSIPSKDYRSRVKKLEASLDALHANIDELVKERLYAVAADISGVPVSVLKNTLVARASGGYCRCRALKSIAAGEDGL